MVHERRSASPISPAFIVRFGSAAVALALIVFSLVFVQKMRSTANTLKDVSTTLSQLKPQHEAQLAMSTNLNHQKAVLLELQGWSKSRLEWYPQFRAIQQLTPPTIQLTDMRTDSLIQTIDKKPTRIFKMSIKGRAVSARADTDVDTLRLAIQKAPEFSGILQEVQIPPGSYRQDPDPRAAKTDRIFEMVLKYKPRIFE